MGFIKPVCFKTVSKHSLFFLRQIWIIAIPLYGEPKPVRGYSTKWSTCNINFYHLSLKMTRSQCHKWSPSKRWWVIESIFYCDRRISKSFNKTSYATESILCETQRSCISRCAVIIKRRPCRPSRSCGKFEWRQKIKDKVGRGQEQKANWSAKQLSTL